MKRLNAFELPADAVSRFVNSPNGLQAVLTPAIDRAGSDREQPAAATAQHILNALLRAASRRFLTVEQVRQQFDDRGGSGVGIPGSAIDEVVALLRAVAVPGPGLPEAIPAEVQEELGVYVYALVDPRDRSVFYVGKGQGNRVYQHVWSALAGKAIDKDDLIGSKDADEVTSAKNARIQEIDSDGFGVEHWIIRYDIEDDVADEVAFAAEQAMIDVLRVAGMELTNLQDGHRNTVHGALPVNELVAQYSAEAIDPSALPYPHGLVKVNAIEHDWSAEQIYAGSRRSWRAGGLRNVIGLPIFVFGRDSIVRAVHRTTAPWTFVGPGGGNSKLWEYTGVPDPELEAVFVGKSLRLVQAARKNGSWQQHGWHPYPELPGSMPIAAAPPAATPTAR